MRYPKKPIKSRIIHKFFTAKVEFLILIVGFVGKNIILSRFSLISEVYSNHGINTGNSIGWRLNVWDIIFKLGLEKPFFGHGLGSSNLVVGSVYKGNFFAPHNEYLRLFYETGGIGLILFIISILVTIVYYLQHGDRKNKLFFLSCVVAYLVMMSTDNIMIYKEISIIFFALIGGILGWESYNNNSIKKNFKLRR
ncbi:O-antigen ligase family protein [Bacillus smithii]|nr:O-antigen ligase family protein [Bacillus smithii]